VNEVSPLLLDIVLHLLLRCRYFFVLTLVRQQLLHVQNRFDALLHVHFLLDDRLDLLHYVDQVVDRVRCFGHVSVDLAHLVPYFFYLVLGLNVQFPHKAVALGPNHIFEFGLELVRGQAHRSDLVYLGLLTDPLVFQVKVCQFLILLRHTRILFFLELLHHVIRIIFVLGFPRLNFV